MAKVLYIQGNDVSVGESKTLKISNEFIKEYALNNPNDEITTINLNKEEIGFLTNEMLEKMYSNEDNIAKKYALDFASYDKYVLAEPLWNLGVPAILKAYIDYICYVGISFTYTESGVVGLLKNKKVVNLTSSGGIISPEVYNHCDAYLRDVFAMMGVTDYQTIEFQGTGVLKGEAYDTALINTMRQVRDVADKF